MDKIKQTRFAFKVVGASGQGINSVGEIVALALKRTGYFANAYREYPSLIKGGHATYQVDFATEPIRSTTKTIDLLVVLNLQRTKWHLEEVREEGLIIHLIPNPRINSAEAEIIRKKKIKLIYIPALEMAKREGGNELMTNIVLTGFVWRLFNMEYATVEAIVSKMFASKPALLEIDLKCLSAGYNYRDWANPHFPDRLPQPEEISNEQKLELHVASNEQYLGGQIISHLALEKAPSTSGKEDRLLISGSEAMSIGAIAAGARAFFSYPMTPASPMLDFLANKANESGMIVKQAEDEITAAAMVIGAMHMGTRAFTATSGGGYDLMTEHVSLAGITETPFVCVLAQRPGPATGLPTWTAQGDLLLAINAAHGEFPRIVLAPKDPEDAFLSIQQALNLAESYQTPVIVLTDKLLAETYYTVEPFNLGVDSANTQIDRGLLVTNPEELSSLTSEARYMPSPTGVSRRWLPGSKAATFNANSDEHDFAGNVSEESAMANEMMLKRQLKTQTILTELPDPELIWNDVDLALAKGTVNFIGWGSTYGVIQDLMNFLSKFDIKVNYLNIKFLWPLKTAKIIEFLQQHSDVVLVEGNNTGQLGQLIRQQTGLEIPHKLLKFDGRPFFLEDILDYLAAHKLVNLEQLTDR